MFDLVGRRIQFDSTVKAQIEYCEDEDVQINNNTGIRKGTIIEDEGDGWIKVQLDESYHWKAYHKHNISGYITHFPLYSLSIKLKSLTWRNQKNIWIVPEIDNCSALL